MNEIDTAIPALYATHSNNRKHVEVHNALAKRNHQGFIEHPHYTHDQIIDYGTQQLVPLNELRYWLLWSNLNRRETGESTFDLPTGSAVLQFVNVTLQKYQRVSQQEIAVTRSVSDGDDTAETSVPMHELKVFLDQFRTDGTFTVSNSQEDRERVILALDKFVGTYL